MSHRSTGANFGVGASARHASPAGTQILFREPSLWDRYKIYILGSLAVLLAQTTLIAGLLVQRARRREAEERVRQSQAELRASYDRISDLGGRLISAQEAERSHIARELHDDINQKIAIIEIDLHLLENCHSNQEDAKRHLRDAAERVQDVAKSLHDLSHRLHPVTLSMIGLVAALSRLQHNLSRPDLTITFSHENIPAALPPSLALCLFRVAQEALQNAVKHSEGHEVWMHLNARDHEINLAVADNGVGFDVDAAWGNGLGLISMRERLDVFGGTLTIHSGPDIGTRVEVGVPFAADQA